MPDKTLGLLLTAPDASAGACSICLHVFRVALLGSLEHNFTQLLAQFKVHAILEHHSSEPPTCPVIDPEPD